MECSVQVDTIGKECLIEKKHLYQYKGAIGIPPLAMVDDLLCISQCGLPTVLLNSYLNTKTSIKKLQFGVEKCHHMHVGKSKNLCPDLFIDEWKLLKKNKLETGFDNLDEKLGDEVMMEKVHQDKYLGDIIAADGTNERNIQARKEKGFGNIDQIMNIFRDYSFGPYYFLVAVMFRNSMLVNSVLCNSEVWYNLSETNLSQLEAIDENLLRRIFETGGKTPKAMLYLELGIYPIRFIIQNRRVMYLHYLLTNKNILPYRFFQAQQSNPCKGDWSETVKNDLSELDLTLSHDEISKMSKARFQTLVKERIRKIAFAYLVKKKEKNKETSKTKDIIYKSLEIQPYLLPNQMSTNSSDSTQLCKFTFSLRCRMVRVKENYKSSNESLTCELCNSHIDSQKNLLTCKALTNDNSIVATPPDYEDLFCCDPEKQLSLAILLREKFKMRKDKINKKGDH